LFKNALENKSDFVTRDHKLEKTEEQKLEMIKDIINEVNPQSNTDHSLPSAS